MHRATPNRLYLSRVVNLHIGMYSGGQENVPWGMRGILTHVLRVYVCIMCIYICVVCRMGVCGMYECMYVCVCMYVCMYACRV